LAGSRVALLTQPKERLKLYEGRSKVVVQEFGWEGAAEEESEMLQEGAK
jgi:hypothetical protein